VTIFLILINFICTIDHDVIKPRRDNIKPYRDHFLAIRSIIIVRFGHDIVSI